MSISENWYIAKKYYKKNWCIMAAKMLGQLSDSKRFILHFVLYRYLLIAVYYMFELRQFLNISVMICLHSIFRFINYSEQHKFASRKWSSDSIIIIHQIFCSWFSVRFCILKSFTKVFVLVIESLDRSSSRYYEAQIHAACCFIEMETWSV